LENKNIKIKLFKTDLDLNNRVIYLKFDLILTIFFLLFFIGFNYFKYNEFSVTTVGIFGSLILFKILAFFYINKNRLNTAAQIINISEFVAILGALFFITDITFIPLLLVITIISPILNLKFHKKNRYLLSIISFITILLCLPQFRLNFFENSTESIHTNFQILTGVFTLISIRAITYSLLFNQSYARLNTNLSVLKTLYSKAPIGVILRNKNRNFFNINEEVFKKFKIEKNGNSTSIVNPKLNELIDKNLN